MRFQIYFLAATAMLQLSPATVSAIDGTAVNQSPEYISSGGIRNASLDIDAAFFNPAGLPFIGKNGFYFMVGNQFLFNERTIEDRASGQAYHGSVDAYLFPTLAGALKLERWAFFLHAGPYGGGASADFPEGTVDTNTPIVNIYQIKVFPVIVGGTLGAAYAIGDWISLAIGLKLYYATSSMRLRDRNGDGAFTSNADGLGYGFLFGLDLNPYEQINIGFQFVWNSKLEAENETETASGTSGMLGELLFKDGSKERAQLPMYTSLGVSYQLVPWLKLEVDGMLYLEGLNDQGEVKSLFCQTNGEKVHKYFDHGFEIGMGVESALFDRLLILYTGYLYGKDGLQKEVTDEFLFYPDYHQIGFGVTVRVIEQLSITSGYMIVLMEQDKVSCDDRKSFKDEPIHIFGIGIKGSLSL